MAAPDHVTWYAQARAQGRWADHPSDRDWVRLERVGDFNLLVQEARSVPLFADLLKSVEADASPHRIELTVRRRYRQTVDDLAGWAPADWRDAIGWMRWLVDLPLLRAAVIGADFPEWLDDDEAWRSLARSTPEQRAESGLGALWDTADMLDAWLARWRALWPAPDAELQQLEDAALATRDAVARGDGAPAIDDLAATARRIFRRRSGSIAALFAFLALTWIDLVRTRAVLLDRRLFAAGAPS